MPFKKVLGLFLAIIPPSWCFAEARWDPPLDMEILSRQFDACLAVLERRELMDRHEMVSAGMSLCREFLAAIEDYRPGDWAKTDYYVGEYAALSRIKGVGMCFRTAQLLQDPEKVRSVLAYLMHTWESIAHEFSTGRIEEFRVEAGGFADELYIAGSEGAGAFYMGVPLGSNFWNSSCAGFFGTARNDVAESIGNELTFVLDNTKSFLTVTGIIGPGFTRELMTNLEGQRFVSAIILSSVGGSDVEEAMTAGHLIRARGLRTVALGNCESACTILFAAGQSRRVGLEYSQTVRSGRLGFHRMSVYGVPIPDDSELYEKVADYFRSMGAFPDSVIDFMKRRDGLAFYYPSLQELCAADVIGLEQTKPINNIGHESYCEESRFTERYPHFVQAPD